MTQQTYSANDVLMGAAGPKAWKFAEPGDTHSGTIAEPPQAKQEREYDPNNPGGGNLKFFPSGDPIMGVQVVVSTDERDPSVEDDDGKRTFYVEGRYIKEAVREAVRTAGASGLEVGGKLQVTFTHREDPTDKRSRKYWNVAYTPAGNAALMGEQQPAPAPAAQPAQASAQAPAQPAQAASAPAQEESPAAKAKQLHSLGLPADAIAGQLGLDESVVQMLLTA